MVLASDHGHVWHRDQAATPAPGADARWRPADGAANEGEVLLEGPRVLGAEGTHRADRPLGRGRPLPRGAERLPRRGDAPGDGRPAGRARRRDLPPARAGAVRAAPAGLVGGAGRPATCRDRGPDVRPRRPTQDPRRLPVPAGAGAGRGGGSRARARHGVPRAGRGAGRPVLAARPDRVAGLPGRSGRWSASSRPRTRSSRRSWRRSTARAGRSRPPRWPAWPGVPALRIDGLIAKLQRLLNYDGYDVLRLDRDQARVVLNLDLLKRQFDLD